MGKKKFYINEEGVIEVTPFFDKQINKNEEFIELSFEEWEKNLSICKYGFKKAYINNEIVEVEDKEVQASEEYQKNIKEIEVSELKNYLSATDYIITKLNEAKIEDDALFEELKIKYSEVITKRKEARERINTLEQELS